MKEALKNIAFAKYAIIVARAFKMKPGVFTRLKQLASYFNDYREYRRLPQNSAYTMLTRDLFPRIEDKTRMTDVDPVYFLQGCWCAKKVFENRPSRHYDIASQALMVGIISQFVSTTMIDIRPLSVTLPGLSFIKGDITNLPFQDGEIDSLSSICVIEHIGLGRYGDPLDQFGTEKAARELERVLSKGGNLYISVPIDSQDKVYFNAHRAFTKDRVMELFRGLSLAEEKYIYGKEMKNEYESTKGFGTGLYHFRKL
jgi:SAM-dependent methyltransferase